MANLTLNLDGPALTMEGIALDASNGEAMHFSHAKDRSPSHAAKAEAKDAFRLEKATRLAHAGEEALQSGAASVDPAGVVHGTEVLLRELGDKSATATRMKVAQKKRHGATPGSGCLAVNSDGLVCGNTQPVPPIGADGVVHASSVRVIPNFGGEQNERKKAFHRKKSGANTGGDSEDGHVVYSVDASGKVGGATRVNNGAAPIDAEGVVRTPSGLEMAPAQPKSPSSKQLKTFHRKCVAGHQSMEAKDVVISVDVAGYVRNVAPVLPILEPASPLAHWDHKDTCGVSPTYAPRVFFPQAVSCA